MMSRPNAASLKRIRHELLDMPMFMSDSVFPSNFPLLFNRLWKACIEAGIITEDEARAAIKEYHGK